VGQTSMVNNFSLTPFWSIGTIARPIDDVALGLLFDPHNNMIAIGVRILSVSKMLHYA